MSYSKIEKRLKIIINRQEQINNLIKVEEENPNPKTAEWTNLNQLEYLKKLKETDLIEINSLQLQLKKLK